MLLETQMDAGPAKVRRRYTAAVTPGSGTITVSVTQLATFQTFVRTDCLGGALPFDWVRASTQAACVMRFKKGSISYGHVEADNATITFKYEILP